MLNSARLINRILQKSYILNTTAIIVEDYQMMADAWEMVLKTKGFSSIRKFVDSNGLLESIESDKPDVILMDVNLNNDENGIEITKELTQVYPDIKVIILTIHDHRNTVLEAFKAGAVGYVTKGSALQQIEKALDAISDGQLYVCQEIMDRGFDINRLKSKRLSK